jgi:hypothetical protein
MRQARMCTHVHTTPCVQHTDPHIRCATRTPSVHQVHAHTTLGMLAAHVHCTHTHRHMYVCAHVLHIQLHSAHTHMPEHAHMEHTCAHTHTLSQADKDRSNLPSLLSEYLSRTITEQKFTGVEMCKLKALEDSLHGRNENLFSTGGSRS